MRFGGDIFPDGDTPLFLHTDVYNLSSFSGVCSGEARLVWQSLFRQFPSKGLANHESSAWGRPGHPGTVSVPPGHDCTGRLFVLDRAHLVFDFHRIVDGLKEVELGGSRVCYSGKASRSGLRVHHLFNPRHFCRKVPQAHRQPLQQYDTEGEILRYCQLADRLKPYVVDNVVYLQNALSAGERVLVTWTSAPLSPPLQPPLAASAPASVSRPRMVGYTIGVAKAYTTRIGGGPFLTEQPNPAGAHLQVVSHAHSCLDNGYDAFNFTKVDVLDTLPTIDVAVAYRVDGAVLDGFLVDLGYQNAELAGMAARMCYGDFHVIMTPDQILAMWRVPDQRDVFGFADAATFQLRLQVNLNS
ncbi:P-loop containing nucleoside triphosphate hydrolase protein [Mycena sp. CBHHK59/15]|nr:P-loop containing nucleoside triphosphate hydrolase protein [Mycena sp. CBHHK59/15]